MDQRDMWFPIDGSGKVVGRFVDTSIDVTNKDGEQTTFVRPALESKVAGNSSEVAFQLVKPFNEKELIARCPEGWKHYKALKEAEKAAPPPQSGVPLVSDMPVKGIPIEELGLFSHDKVVWFKTQGIYTVEQIADLSDTVCQNLGFGAKAWRKKANDYMKQKGRIAA